uniref:Secreted protein n=1 Tax=Ciona intestinalis TaxID=7719 RepID=H2XVY4_CIOIN
MLRKCVLGFCLSFIGISNFVTGNNVTLTSLNVFEGEIKNLKLNCSSCLFQFNSYSSAFGFFPFVAKQWTL